MTQIDTMKEAARLRQALTRIEKFADFLHDVGDAGDFPYDEFEEIRDIARAALADELHASPVEAG